MDTENTKCVMVVAEDLPAGLIANAAGIMGITLGTSRNYRIPGACFKGGEGENKGNQGKALPAGFFGFAGGGLF